MSKGLLMRSIFVSVLSFLAIFGLFLLGTLAPANAGPSLGNVLIVAGTDNAAQQAATTVSGELTTAGFTVTVVNTGVPVSLAGYSQIYDTRYDNNPAFTSGEMAQYLAFLNAAPGNTLFLMGENQSFNVRNGPILQFVTLAGGGTIAAPALTSSNTEQVMPPFTMPNMINTIQYAACGVVTSHGTGNFASLESGGATGCSLFFDEGQLANALTGALVVVFDVNFMATAPTGSAINEIPFRKNLEHFAAAPPSASPNLTPIPSTALLLLIGGCGIVAFEVMRARKRARETPSS
jgi:hypothetical protein